jgi:hypothetical protein
MTSFLRKLHREAVIRLSEPYTVGGRVNAYVAQSVLPVRDLVNHYPHDGAESLDDWENRLYDETCAAVEGQDNPMAAVITLTLGGDVLQALRERPKF